MTYGNNNSLAHGQQNLRAVTNQTTDGSTHPTSSSGATMQTQHKGASQTYNQVSANGIVRRRVENLPRTGIEYPMMRDLGHAPFFQGNQKEFEPLLETRPSPLLLEEYIKNDADRSENASNSLQLQVVYDYIEQSPYYEGEGAKQGPFIEEKDLIELPNPSEQGNGAINEPYQKRYYFNPQNLPYSLEQSHLYGQSSSGANERQSIIQQKRSGISGPRLNRYYEKLKPYYRIDFEKVEETNPDDPNPKALPIDKTLQFESRFESGNLRKAMKVGPVDYELYLKNDYGTQSFCQWYFFRI